METCKYLGMLEADTIKQAEIKEKLKKNASKGGENYSKPNYVAEILSKGINTGDVPFVRYSRLFLN